MYCPFCGKKVNDNDKYCIVCGRLIKEDNMVDKPLNIGKNGKSSDNLKTKNSKSQWVLVGLLSICIFLVCFIVYEIMILMDDKEENSNTATEILADKRIEQSDDHDTQMKSESLSETPEHEVVTENTQPENIEPEKIEKDENSIEEEPKEITGIEEKKEKSSPVYVKMEESENTGAITTYNEVLDNVYARYANGDSLMYVMYDMDKNGVQEMLVSEGSSDAVCVWNVYTKVNGEVISTGQCPGAYSSLCAASDGCLYMVNCNDNYEELYRTYLEDNTLYVTLVEAKYVNDKSEYYFPKGEYLTGKYITDRSLINE